MNRTKFKVLIVTTLISSLFLSYSQPANSAERKKANWLASCPEVLDSTPELPTFNTISLLWQNQEYKLLSKDSVEFVTAPQSMIGCYVYEANLINPDQSPAWQIGALNRDLQGFYFKNQAGVVWRLILNTQNLILETEPGSMYYTKGAGFGLDAQAKADVEQYVRDTAELRPAAVLKAQFDGMEKYAAELKAKQDAEAKAAALKKTTITCLKGKLIKKVTAVKPVCPKGYKKK